MQRLDRLFAIVLELQGRKRVRAEDLARQFAVSKRTIYRDVFALNGSGVPVVSIPGQGYTLMPGYFLPPLQFSPEEAVTLLLGSDVTAQAFGAGLADAAQTAARKITAVLREEAQREVQVLRDSLRLVQRDPGTDAVRSRVLTLRQATVDRRAVRFAYRKPRTEPEWRQAEPHGLYRLDDLWLLAAFDSGRNDMRHFRLDRMDGLQVLPRRFERQAGYRLGARAAT